MGGERSAGSGFGHLGHRYVSFPTKVVTEKETKPLSLASELRVPLVQIPSTGSALKKLGLVSCPTRSSFPRTDYQLTESSSSKRHILIVKYVLLIIFHIFFILCSIMYRLCHENSAVSFS